MSEGKTHELRHQLAEAEVEAPFTDDPEFLASVERGYLQCEAGLAEEVQDDDTFFQDIIEEIRKNPEAYPQRQTGARRSVTKSGNCPKK